MDKTTVLIDLLKNKEFDAVNAEQFSMLLGKNIFLINKVFIKKWDPELQDNSWESHTAESLATTEDPRHRSTLYLTEDTYLPVYIYLGSWYTTIQQLEIKDLDDNILSHSTDPDFDNYGSLDNRDYTWLKIDQPQNIDNRYTPCYVNIYVELVDERE